MMTFLTKHVLKNSKKYIFFIAGIHGGVTKMVVICQRVVILH